MMEQEHISLARLDQMVNDSVSADKSIFRQMVGHFKYLHSSLRDKQKQIQQKANRQDIPSLYRGDYKQIYRQNKLIIQQHINSKKRIEQQLNNYTRKDQLQFELKNRPTFSQTVKLHNQKYSPLLQRILILQQKSLSTTASNYNQIKYIDKINKIQTLLSQNQKLTLFNQQSIHDKYCQLVSIVKQKATRKQVEDYITQNISSSLSQWRLTFQQDSLKHSKLFENQLRLHFERFIKLQKSIIDKIDKKQLQTLITRLSRKPQFQDINNSMVLLKTQVQHQILRFKQEVIQMLSLKQQKRKAQHNIARLSFQDLQGINQIKQNYNINQTRDTQKIKVQQLLKSLHKQDTSIQIQLLRKQFKLQINQIFAQFKQQQSQRKHIVSDLCTQHLIGRWTWKSGQLDRGKIIWQQQVINTFPQSYIYHDKSPYIKIVNAGIYQVTIGIFSLEIPQAQLIINGQSIIKKSKIDWKAQHSQMAYSITKFLFLQQLSLISVATNPGAQAFLYIKRT